MAWTPQISYLRSTAKETADAANESSLLQQKYDLIVKMIKDAAQKGQYSIKVHNRDLLQIGDPIYNQLIASSFGVNDPTNTDTYTISWGD